MSINRTTPHQDYKDWVAKANQLLEFLNIPFEKSGLDGYPKVQLSDLLEIFEDPNKRDHLISKLKLMAFQ